MYCTLHLKLYLTVFCSDYKFIPVFLPLDDKTVPISVDFTDTSV